MADITEEQFRKLKREVEEASRKAEQSKGAYNQLLTDLKEEFDCQSAKEGRARLEELKEKLEEAEKDFEKEMASYRKEWADESS